MYSHHHVSDEEVTAELQVRTGAEREGLATILSLLAEVDARKLHAPMGYSSTFSYCVERLGYDEGAAYKRIAVARAGRVHRVIFEAIADGRLHLSGAYLLVPHVDASTVDGLVAAASGKSKRAIEAIVAAHRPRPDVAAYLARVPVQVEMMEQPPGAVDNPSSAQEIVIAPKVTALAPERFALQVTLDQKAHDDLRRLQALLRHQVPDGDLGTIVGKALEALIEKVEKQKFGATDRPRAAKASTRRRYVSKAVMREVHARDGEQCAFVGTDGHRCEARAFLEYDHVDPVALGGGSSATNVRLLCKSHNQLEAERRMGKAFMGAKRFDADALSALKNLDVTPELARRALAASAGEAATTLEERIRAALRVLGTLYASGCREARVAYGGGA